MKKHSAKEMMHPMLHGQHSHGSKMAMKEHEGHLMKSKKKKAKKKSKMKKHEK